MKPEPITRWSERTCVRPPVVGDGVVVWIRSNGTAMGTMRDRVVWEHPIDTGVFQPLDIHVSIASIDGRQLVRVGRQLALLDGGSVIWSRENVHAGIHFSCGDHSSLIGYAGSPTRLEAIDLSSGTSSILFERPNFGQPILATRDIIVTRELHRGIGIDRASGAERWSTLLTRPSTGAGGGLPTGQPAHFDDVVVFPIAGYGFVALRHADGSVAWDHEPKNGRGGGQQTMSLRDGVVHMFDGKTYLELDAKTGAVRTSRDIKSMCQPLGIVHVGLPAFYKQFLIAVDSSGTACAYDREANEITWHSKLGTSVPYACWPVVADDTLWIMDVRGQLHVFALEG